MVRLSPDDASMQARPVVGKSMGRVHVKVGAQAQVSLRLLETSSVGPKNPMVHGALTRMTGPDGRVMQVS